MKRIGKFDLNADHAVVFAGAVIVVAFLAGHGVGAGHASPDGAGAPPEVMDIALND